MKIQFTAMYEKDGDWWVGRAVEIPGAYTQGKTLEETRTMLLDAVQTLIRARRKITKTELDYKHHPVEFEYLTVEIE